jgi:hypothetical protein
MKSDRKPGMKRGKTPFTAKLRPELKLEVVPDGKGRGQMLLPTPMLVAAAISAVPEGELITVPTLRLRLAKANDADLTCPLMTGIFFNIIAGAVEEQLEAGEPPVAPYWRVILDDGTLSPKTPSGPERHAEHLRSEGHTIQARGAKLQVADYQSHVVT